MAKCNTKYCTSLVGEVAELQVLVVGKEPAVEQSLIELLNKGGIEKIKAIRVLNGKANLENQLDPDIVFINPDGFKKTPFEIFKWVRSLWSEARVVFIGTLDEESATAFPFGSINYLDMPASYRSLEKIVSSVLTHKKYERWDKIMHRLNGTVCPVKLKFSTRTGHVFLDPEEIIYMKADSNYTHVILRDQKQITVSKSLAHI